MKTSTLEGNPIKHSKKAECNQPKFEKIEAALVIRDLPDSVKFAPEVIYFPLENGDFISYLPRGFVEWEFLHDFVYKYKSGKNKGEVKYEKLTIPPRIKMRQVKHD